MKRTSKAKVQTEQEQSQHMELLPSQRVVQANQLIRAKQDALTVFEARLIRLAISQVLKDAKEFKPYVIGVSELARLLNMPKSNIGSLKNIDAALHELKRKVIRIETDDGISYINWTKSIYLDKKKKVVSFKLDDDLKPYLLGLNELFTRYEYESILELPTNYSIRLYELLVSYASLAETAYIDYHLAVALELEKGQYPFYLEELRDFFDCKYKYNQTKEFIRRVIAPSVKAINEKTELRIEYTPRKEGHSIRYIVFTYFNRLEYALKHTPNDDKEMQEKAKRAEKAMKMVEEYRKRQIKEKSL